MDSNLLKTKSIEQLVGDAESGTKALKRTLTAMDLTLLGIGAIIGTGIFVLTGTAAANQAGPAIVLSYVLAGLACAFAALCYAEFAAMIPISGSAYTYAYATLGEIFAWMIGWDLILEYAVGSMTVAVGWSGYFQRILVGFDLHLPVWMSAAPAAGVAGAVVNLPAIIIVLVISCLLVIGVRESARFNAVMVAVKLAAILFFIVVGAGYVKPENWSPFMPYGWAGISAAAAVVFFAYIGFDAVSTTAEEAKNPSRDLPIGIIASLIICTVLYLSVAAILSGIIPVVRLQGRCLVPERSGRFRAGGHRAGLGRRSRLGRRGRRHHQRAARDAAEPAAHLLRHESRPAPAAGRQQGAPEVPHPLHHDAHHRRRRGHRRGVHTDPDPRGDDEHRNALRVRGGVDRRHHPAGQAAGRPRPFKVPGGHIIPVLGVLSCTYLMIALTVMTWVRFLVWLDLGMIIYWFYGRTHSQLVNHAETAARSSLENFANFLKMAGYMLVFNGFCITLLGLMTEWGVTTEELAKWHELDAVLSRWFGLHINPQIADAFGLRIMAVGLVAIVLGFVLVRSAKKS